MHEIIEYIRAKCKENGGSVAKMERDCGFGNGYFNPKKLKRIPYEKAVIIAEYLNVPLNKVWKAEQKENPTVQTDSEVDEVTIELMDIIQNGTDEDRQDLLEMYRMLKRREQR